jgi:hypothetical protein
MQRVNGICDWNQGEALTHDIVVGYLNEKIKGKRIFQTYEDENVLPCYLYHLENKTVINAHLIKHGMVLIDCSYNTGIVQNFLGMVQ